MKTKYMHLAVVAAAAFATVSAAPAIAQAPAAPATSATVAAPQPDFASPADAVAALVAAVRAADPAAVTALMGPGAGEWLLTGDKVSDREEWTRFIASYDKMHKIAGADGATATLVIGDDWPFPAPIVKKGDRWVFDGDAGREEVTNRRVGRNELDTIQTLLAIVDAQREYAAADPDKNGFNDYARRIVSSEGKRDGLYWPVKAGEPGSPLGPLIAEAAREGYSKKEGERQPYNGYFYGLLTSQGKSAPGGAYDYSVGDNLIGGFGVVAYPSKYGVSGVMTFVVNHDGVVWEKDLGPDSADVAAKMTVFDPDAGWSKSPH